MNVRSMNSYLRCSRSFLGVVSSTITRPSILCRPPTVYPYFSIIPPPTSNETKAAAVVDDDAKATKRQLISNGIDSTAIPTTESADEVLAKTAIKVQKPRPIFPWRHEPVDNPLPRLTPGTAEYRESSAFHFSGKLQRFTAFWFLSVPWRQTLFNFDGWRQDMALSAGYAFAQGVAGIVSNAYHVPFDTVASDADKITFQYPPELMNETDDELIASISGSDEATKLDNSEKEASASAPVVSPITNAGEESIEVPSAAPSLTNEKEVSSTSSTSGPGTTDEKEEPGTDTAKTNEDSFCPQIKDMLIEPLRKLFESAHESGRDQLIIKLQMEPVRAFLFNIVCCPYVTRADTVNSPGKLKLMKSLRSMSAQEAFRTVFETLDNDLKKTGKLETTVELQVLVICNEIFQVIDRESGAVLQGSQDGSEQVVAHLVRLETTSVQEVTDNATRAYCTDWQITDIDDLLGHVAWYQK